MTAARITCLLVGVLVVVVVTASCGASAPARFYTLNSKATADGKPAASYGVAIGMVSVPAAVDRPQLVIQVAPNRVEIDEFNRWAAPLGDSIAGAVAADLSVLLGTPNVATAPGGNFDPSYRVTIDVRRFDSIPGEGVVIEAVWAVSRMNGDRVHSGRTTTRESVQSKSVDALVAAHSSALTQLSSDIAAAIRASAKPLR